MYKYALEASNKKKGWKEKRDRSLNMLKVDPWKLWIQLTGVLDIIIYTSILL